MGVHYSKVRSLTLDGWEPEIVKVMMELGNDVINSIYEATYLENGAESQVESQTKRATSDCDTNVREMWIKAKYIEKTFVRPIDQLMSSECEAAESRMNIFKDIVLNENIWYVRHIRNKKITIETEEENPKSRVAEVDDNASSSELSIDPNQPFNGLDLSDFTDEDVDTDCRIEKEDLECLNSDMLLYQATNVHNLPIMCYALAAGASKTWCNEKDSHRSAIHRAVLSVS